MIKIAQIMDKDTLGLNHLETYKGEIINLNVTNGIIVLLAEVIDFDGETPVSFIREQEFTVDLDNLNELTVRELLQGQI